MRHASIVGARPAAVLLLAATFACSPPAAQALNFSGGTPALSATPSSSASDSTAQAGGAPAASTQGTGGTEYRVLAAKARILPKAVPRKPAHPARRHIPQPKPRSKPTPPPPAPPPPVESGSPPGVPTPAQTASEGAAFPVLGTHNFGNAENSFGAARSEHIHEGQDVLASEGQQVVAPLAGTIITAAYQAGAGWYAAEHTIDGLDFFFAHCQSGSLAVSAGEAVTAGQPLCKIGQTGDATGPHLHFEVWVGGWQAAVGHPIDPLPYLKAWDHAPGG